MKKALPPLACVTLLAATLVAGEAIAGFPGITRYATKVNIKSPAPSTFSGRVKSGHRFCRVKRKVVVRRVEPGADPVIGADRTNARARYRVLAAPPTGGDYYARATRKLKLISGRGIICRKDTSPLLSITFPEP